MLDGGLPGFLCTGCGQLGPTTRNYQGLGNSADGKNIEQSAAQKNRVQLRSRRITGFPPSSRPRKRPANSPGAVGTWVATLSRNLLPCQIRLGPASRKRSGPTEKLSPVAGLTLPMRPGVGTKLITETAESPVSETHWTGTKGGCEAEAVHTAKHAEIARERASSLVIGCIAPPSNSRVSGLRSLLSPHLWLESSFLLILLEMQSSVGMSCHPSRLKCFDSRRCS
jgi:hypothetical protein